VRLNTLRIIVATVPGMLLASDAGAEQLSSKGATIGVLGLNSNSPAIFDAFRQGLHDLGYIEGQTFTLEIRHAGGQEEALPNLAVELSQRHVDVIVQQATKFERGQFWRPRTPSA
jgi:putative ABC transport system substrate-binding protein